MSDPSFEISAQSFAELVTPLLPLASQDVMFPVLNCVKFETEKGYLLGTVTDRFRIGIHRVPVIDVPDGLSFLLSLASVRRIGALFKSTRFSDPALRFTVQDDRVRIAQTGGLDFMDASVDVRLADGVADFPDVRKLITDAITTDTEGLTDIAYNAAYLADFKSAVTKGSPLRVRLVAVNRPTIVTAGDDFIGAIMPVRDIEAQDVLGHWNAFLQPAKPKRAPRKAAAAKKEVA